MISKITGEIHIGNVKIDSEFRKGDFLISSLCSQVVRHDNDSYSRYALSPQKIGDDLFAVALFFDPDGRLTFVSLSILFDEKLPNWKNWSQEEQLHKKRVHDDWLNKHLGLPPYDYWWGSVYSQYDPRSATSTITIKYHFRAL